jgi:hypothetical protein
MRGIRWAAVCLTASLAASDVSSVIARRNWWAFQRPVRAETPDLHSTWVRTPIDAFLLAAMREKKLTPSAPADKERLLRRVTYDLTGLPPTPGEIDLFLRDRSPNAYEKVVDRLLASPHYGERWALRWLDVVRYADTNGFESDRERPHAWRYRDYVVDSFNSDKPYDRFVKEQIAGDELYPRDRQALIATGFYRAGPLHVVGGVKDEEADRQEVLTEMTGALGSVFFGMTIGCARCHNHKFDPILQSDYYRLQAVLAATNFKDVDIATPEERAARELAAKEHMASLQPIRKEIAAMEKPYRDKLTEIKKAKLAPAYVAVLEIPKEKRTEEQRRLAKEAEAQLNITWDQLVDSMSAPDRGKRAALRERMHEIERYAPAPAPAAFAVVNMEKDPPPTYILKVGDVKHKMGQVEPGVPVVLDTGHVQIPKTASGRRAALANWLARPEHPLTARVMVNRIWQFRMGTGIAGTPNDFGLLGERPTNLKLMDWLATEFIARNWSVKAIDRMIALSSAYRQSAANDRAKAAIDPENKLYWRMNRKRMEGETIRDSVLAAAGTLNTRLGGRPVRIPIQQEVYDLIFTEGERDGLWPVTPDAREHARRSLYLLNKRTVRLPMLMAFDQPDTMTSCPVRPASTHALQALSLFNSDFMRAQSIAMAKRLERECAQDADFQVRRAYKLALARGPKPAEEAMARQFFRSGGKLEDFCLALLNRNEFVYIP